MYAIKIRLLNDVENNLSLLKMLLIIKENLYLFISGKNIREILMGIIFHYYASIEII